MILVVMQTLIATQAACRLYFMKEISFGQDGDFNERRFQDLANAALANNLGNLLNRSLNLLKKNCASRMPCAAASIPEEHPVRQVVCTAVPAASAAYEGLAIQDAIAAALTIADRCECCRTFVPALQPCSLPIMHWYDAPRFAQTNARSAALIAMLTHAEGTCC